MTRKQFNRVTQLGLIAGLFASHTALADGLYVLTQCKSLDSQDSRGPRISINWKQTVDYRARTGKFEANYDGTIEWDAKPHSIQGSLSTAMPVSNAPVPNLLQSFSISDGESSVSQMLNIEANTKTPSKERHIHFKVQTSGGFLGIGARYAVLKLNMPAAHRGQMPVFGDLYLTDKSESRVTTPDGGSGVMFMCTEEVHDLAR